MPALLLSESSAFSIVSILTLHSSCLQSTLTHVSTAIDQERGHEVWGTAAPNFFFASPEKNFKKRF